MIADAYIANAYEKCEEEELKYVFHFASSEGHLNIIKCFVEKGFCNVEAKNDALRVASSLGRLDIVKYLIERCSCNPNAEAFYGVLH